MLYNRAMEPMDPERQRQAKKAVLILLGVCGFTGVTAFAAMGILGSAIYLERSQQRFRQESWLEQEKAFAASETRKAMAKDLITNHLRPGMDEQEVTKLLGDPDATAPCRNEELRKPPEPEPHHCFEYLIGRRVEDKSTLDLAFSGEGGLLRAALSWR